MSEKTKGPVAGEHQGVRVYKVCPRGAWARALVEGSLPLSADDARDGFVHLSSAAQLAGTLERHFAGQSGLVLLTLETARLPQAALRWEASRDGQLFPHLYGPLDVRFVSSSLDLRRDADGRVELPELG
jgi:uncharacterized protein (DUF952 family)